MSEQIQAAVNILLLWRIWLFELFIVCAINAGTFVLSGAELSARAKLWLGVSVVVLNSMRGPVAKALASLSKGELTPPDMPGDTQIFSQRTTAQVTQVTQSTTLPAKE